jgi:hypothetical protein
MKEVLHFIHSLHQYSYLPLLLFVVALLITYASIHSQKSLTRYLGYVIGVSLVVCCVFIM